MKDTIRRFIKHCIRVLAAAVSLVALLSSAVSVMAAKEQPVRLRVPFPETEGFTMTDENGKRSGLVVDFLYEIAKYTGWSYEFIDTDANEMTGEFIAGKYDLMGGTYYAEGFEQYFAYPDYNCGNTKAVLLARQDDEHHFDRIPEQDKKLGRIKKQPPIPLQCGKLRQHRPVNKTASPGKHCFKRLCQLIFPGHGA